MASTEDWSISVVIPTYNEVGSIIRLVNKVFDVLPDAGILVIDGGSDDGTIASLQAHPKFGNRLLLETQKNSGGIGPAYLQGFASALALGAQKIVQMDADGSHDPSDIKALLSQNADLAIGSRWIAGGKVSGWPLRRHLLSRLANWSSRVTLVPSVRDSTSGFRAMSRELVSHLTEQDSAPRGFAFQVNNTLLASDMGLTLVEVPIHFRERTEGVSSISLENILEAGVWLLKTKSRRLGA
jgi:dolichol-phosphate mannosyltransferase